MAILSAFNPHEFPESTVRAIATGREGVLAEIIETVRGNLGAGTIQHLILSAPRGYGKSFMARHIELEVARIAEAEGLPIVALLMPEEMPHVKEPETLIRELTRALTGGAGADAELTWHEDDGEAWEAAVKALNTAITAKQGEQGLVVALVENFDVLLRRAFPKEVQASRLRQLLTTSGSRLMLIAASASGAFDRSYDNRLFHAFKEIKLTPWTIEECMEFFDRQRRDAGKPPLSDIARGRAQAVAHFIGGTPRLATILGDALFEDDLPRAADLLGRLVDELTPYYKDRIEALPGRSQKLLDALLRGGEPATPSEIARRVKANGQPAIAGPLSELVKERIIMGVKAPDSAEILYRVADRVFAHYYRRRIIDHGTDGCPLEGLVELLADFYSPEEKEQKASEFLRMGRVEEARVMARLLDADRGTNRASREWVLTNLVRDFIPRRVVLNLDDDLRRRAIEIADLIDSGYFSAAYSAVRSATTSATLGISRVWFLLIQSRLDAYEGFDGGRMAADQALMEAKCANDERLCLEAELGRTWSMMASGRFFGAIDAGERIVAQSIKVADQGRQVMALGSIARSLTRVARDAESFKKAAAACRLAAEQAHNVNDLLLEASATLDYAYNLGNLDRVEEAGEIASIAAELASQAGSVELVAGALRICSAVQLQLNQPAEALDMAERSAALAERVKVWQEAAIALHIGATSAIKLGYHEQGIELSHRSLRLAERAGDKWTSIRSMELIITECQRIGGPIAALTEIVKAGRAANDEFSAYTLASWASSVSHAGTYAALLLRRESEDIKQLHLILTAGAPLSDEPRIRVLLRAWIRGLTSCAVRVIEGAEKLESWATAIELHFRDVFPKEVELLRAAAGYHANARDRIYLARLDPDLQSALTTMFPPVDRPPPLDNSGGKRRRR